MQTRQFTSDAAINDSFEPNATVAPVHGDAPEILPGMPSQYAQLIISSPPYHIGKSYEARQEVDNYLRSLRLILEELYCLAF